MTYEWRFNSTNAIVGATNRLLKMTQVQFDSGAYTAVVTN